MADNGRDVPVIDELLRDGGGPHAGAAVVAEDDLDVRSVLSRSGVELIDGELDAATIHRAVLLGPGTGGAEDDRRTRIGAAGNDEGRDGAGDERSLMHHE